MRKTALIIGAGPAGLTAAYKLLKETDILPVIVEQESFVGGISRTAEYKGNRMDIGGHRFFSKSEEVMSIWRELMPPQGSPSLDDLALNREVELAPGGPDPETTDRVLLKRNRVSRIFYLRKFFDYPVSLKLSTILNMGIWNTMRAGFGYIRSAMFKRDEKNLEDFMINRFGKTLYSMFFEHYTEKVWGRAPRDISADWGEQRIKGLSLRKTIAEAFKKLFHIKSGKVETSLIESFYYPKKGPGQLWETMLSDVERMGARVLLSSRVVELNTDNGAVISAVVERNGQKQSIDADYFISSMPIPELIDALGDAVEDGHVKEVASGLPFRDFITVGLLLKKLNIRNTTKLKTMSGIVPDCWIYVQEADVKLGRIQIFNNWSPYMVSDPENTVWVGLEYFCNEGDEMWNTPEADFTKLAIDELCSIGVASRESVMDSVCIKVKKAYPAYFGTYAEFDDVREYLDTIPNLYCVGRNGQHRYNNMDHSMLTAVEAVRAIKSGSISKTDIWSVNTEQEYHEQGSEGSASD